MRSPDSFDFEGFAFTSCHPDSGVLSDTSVCLPNPPLEDELFMPVDLIIDGYNLLHSAGLARATYGPGDLQRARHRLLIRLTSRLTPDEILRTVVVFDAADVAAGDEREEQFRKLRVVYSPPGQEADDVIEELIARHAAPKQLMVVSSDNRLIRAIRRRKGISSTSEAFLDELDKPRRHVVVPEVEPEIDPSPLDAEAVDAWLKEFGMAPDTRVQSIPSHTSAPKPEEPSPVDADRDKGCLPATDESSLLAELEEELRRCLDEN